MPATASNSPDVPEWRGSITPFMPGRYRAILHGMQQAFCLLEVLFDARGRAADYRFLEVNAAFEQLTRLVGPVGHTARELLPGLDPRWLALGGDVARTGQARHLEQPAEPGSSYWYEVYVLPTGPPGGHQVAALFTDVSARKQAEQHHDFLLRLSDTLRPLADPLAMQAAATQAIRAFFGADRCYYGEPEDGQYLIRHDDSRPGLPPVAGTHAPDALPTFGALLAAGRPLVVEDVRHPDLVDEPLRQSCVQLGVAAFINVPVIKDGQPRGGLCVVQGTPRRWTAPEVQLALAVAERTWAAVERSRAESTLRRSEAKYRTLFESIDEGFCIIELLADAHGTVTDYRFLEVNPAFERQTGLTGVVGRPVSELLPAVEPHWLATYEQVARTGEPARLENYHAGTRRWYEACAVRVGGAGSRQVCVVFADITERKRREADQALLAEVSQGLVGVADIDCAMQRLGAGIGRHFGVQQCLFSELSADYETGQSSFWNANGAPGRTATYRLRDYLADELLAASRQGQVTRVYDTQTDPRVNNARYQAAGVGAFVTVPLARENNWQFLLSIVADQPRQWRPDEVELLRELTHRIWTRLEQARAEQARQASEETFRLFVTTTSDTLYRMSPDWQQMLTLNGGTLLADTTQPSATWLQRYIPADDQPAVWAAVQQALAAARPFALEHRAIRADGTVGWLASRAVPVFEAAGRIREWFGTATDITARKQAEEATALRQRLAQQQVLFEAVQQAQEEERRRMAEALHNGLGQLLYAVKIQLDLLPPLPGQPARLEAARLLGDAIRQTRALSHELMPPTLEAFGLQQALETICHQLGGAGLRWHCHIVLDEAPPLPQALQLAVYRLVQGLAHNVARHARATEATLEVEVLPGWVVLRVEDNGRGFDPATVAEGLGLRTLRSRVALLAGTLHLDSAPGQGTHIWARLPVG